MKQKRWWFILIGIALMTSACMPQERVVQELVPSATLSPSPQPSDTIVWFPPTATLRPIVTPTPLPTEDMSPGVSSLLFEEPFTGEVPWRIFRTDMGSVAYGNNVLTIAISQSKGNMYSQANIPLLTDFFLEVTTTASLCRAEDVYGLMFRTTDGLNGYRLLISCGGLLRLERLSNGKVAILQDWTPSAQIRPGAPQILKVGVWAFRDDLRIFINDRFQFNVADRVWSSGVLGIFARSGGENVVSVSYSELKVYSLSVQPTPTVPSPTFTPQGTRPTATPTPIP